MDGYRCYLAYRAVKAHFNTSNYDYFKSNGKLRAQRKHYETRSDKPFFQYIANTYCDEEIVNIFLSNIFHHTDFWVGEVNEKKCEEIHRAWKSRLDSLDYQLEQAINLITEETEIADPAKALKASMRVVGKDHPLLLTFLLQDEISPELFLILDVCFNIMDKWDVEIKEKLIWPKVKRRCLKYKPFLIKVLSKQKIQRVTRSLANKLNMGRERRSGGRQYNSERDSVG